MKIAADANLHRRLVAELRALGHDVNAIAETAPTAADNDILAEALAEQRIVVTADKDFGELVFRQGLPTHGVVFLRVPTLTPFGPLAARISAALPEAERAFVTLTKDRKRVRKL